MDVQKSALRIGDVTDYNPAQIFWDSLNAELRLRLKQHVLVPATTALTELATYTERNERILSEKLIYLQS